MPLAAAIARVSQRTLRRWCQRGYVKGANSTRGGHWRMRVFITQKDSWIIQKRVARGEGTTTLKEEFEGRVFEKVWDAIKPPPKPHRWLWNAAREAAKESGGLNGESFQKLYGMAAWEKIAGHEFGESIGEPIQSLAPVMANIRRLGYLPAFAGEMEMPEKVVRAARGNPLLTAFYGAARNIIQQKGNCSVADVCARLGISRATAYRKKAVAGVVMAKKELVRLLPESPEPKNAPKKTTNPTEN